MTISDSIVARNVVEHDGDRFLVSTVQLPSDDVLVAMGAMYETMVFGIDNEGNVTSWGELECQRYMRREEAVQGHLRMVALYSTASAS
jgi:hypothetical protein